MKCCPKCGKMGVTSNYNEKCPYCNHPTIETKYTYKEYLDNIDSIKQKILNEYVKKSPEYNEELHNKQLKDTEASTHGIGSSYGKPKCPTCGSTNVNKISGVKKAAGFMTVGVFSSNFGKTMECKNCGYKW